MKLILHDYRRCPFCIRVRIVLHLKNISYEHVHEPLREWTPWMLEHVKQPRVPVLHVQKKDETEIIMPESNDINLWLDKSFGELVLTPEEHSHSYAKMVEWWDWCADVFKHQIDLYKYGEDRNFDDTKHIQHKRDLQIMLQKIEDSLASSDYLLGNDISLADIAIIPFIRQIMRTRNGEFDFSPYKRITKWSGTILNQDWFNDIVMAKYV